MFKQFFKKNLGLISFFLVFILLGYFTSQLFLFYDDVNFLFPSVVGDYFVHFKNYIANYGLFRPLALPYYYFIYTIYLHFPYIAHLIPLIVFAIACYLIFKIIIMQGINKVCAFLCSLLIFTLPFSVEAYSWLSANTGIFVFFLFFFQIYLLEKYNPTIKLLQILLFLQIIAVLINEQTIFMFLGISMCWYYKYSEYLFVDKKKWQKITTITAAFIPFLFYFLTKIIIIPHFQTRARLISFGEFFTNWHDCLKQLSNLFSYNGLRFFWKEELTIGFNLIASNLFIVCLFILFIITFGYILFSKYLQDNKQSRSISNRATLILWGIFLLLSILPLSWQTNYLPFRTLLLPTSLLLIFIAIFVNKVFSFSNGFILVSLKIIALFLLMIFIAIDIAMLNSYKLQYLADEKIIAEIKEKTLNLGFQHPYRTNLYLQNFPSSPIISFMYGDYMHSMFHNYWSAEALIDLNMGTIKYLGIETQINNEYLSRIPKNELLNLRPLTFISFSGQSNCFFSNKDCLTVIRVLK